MYFSEYTSGFSGPAASHLAAPPSPRHEGNIGQAPAIFSAGVCLWFLYGLFLHSWPIILTNFIPLLLTGAILLLKLRYRVSGGSYGGLEQLPAIPWVRV